MRAAASLSAAWLLCAAPAGAAGRGPAPQEGEPVRLPLAERLDVADVDTPLESLDFVAGDEARWRTAGWNLPRQKHGGHAWTRGRDAVVEVPVVRPQPRVLELRVSHPGRARFLPRQQLTVLWNGHEIGGAELPDDAPRTLRFDVPPALQWVGPNRIHLLPRYWTPGPATGDASDTRRGVRVSLLRLEASDPEVATAGPSARREGDDIVQAPGTVLSFGLPLPAGARLRGRLRVEGKAGAEAAATVALLAPGRTASEVAHWSAADLAEGSELDLPLGSGGPAVLSLAFSLPRSRAADGGASPRLRWGGLRVEGRAPAPGAVPRVRRATGPVNVLLVLFDTLRADHTEPYGATHVQTPHLRRLAERGVTYLDATANASWTRASVASLLTSLTPAAHGVTGLRSALPPETIYLPEILQRRGYTTIGIVNSPQINEATGFERGFETIVDHSRLARPAGATPEEHARSVWERHVEPALEADAPFFVYLHEIDPHAPYNPPAPFDDLYGFGYQGNVSSKGQGTAEQLRVLRLLRDGRRWLDDADVRHLRSLYAGEVTYMDRYLGWILARLEEGTPAGPTLVVFVSDHGEEFLEHGTWGHGRNVHQPALEVPLIVSLPGVLPEGRRVEIPAQLNDVPATVLDVLGLEPPPNLAGRSLLPWALAQNPDVPDRPAFFHSMPMPNPRHGFTLFEHGVRFGRWKLLRRTRLGDGVRTRSYALYDLAEDPEERLDRWSTEPAVGHTLRQILAHYERSAAEGRPREREAKRDLETERALRALGYAE